MRSALATAEAAADPKPGDFWHEMMIAICLVVARHGDHVCVCWDKEDCQDDSERFVFTHPIWSTVAEFRDRLSYDSIPGYWAEIAVRGADVSSYASLIPPIFDPALSP
jgi:hypothetical protein